MKLVAFCEARADFLLLVSLTDRVLREAGPGWVRDLLDGAADGVRQWIADPAGNAFFDVHRLDQMMSALHVRALHGHFDGAPGAAGAQMARNAFRIVRALRGANDVDAALLVWDMDGDEATRGIGLQQARTEALRWADFRIVVGRPTPTREAWVLAGFEPESDEERARLDELRRELGFPPHEESHRLNEKDAGARRNAKRVLATLATDSAREERCWTAAPTERLRARGAHNGLAEFLDELEREIVPLCRRR